MLRVIPEHQFESVDDFVARVMEEALLPGAEENAGHLLERQVLAKGREERWRRDG
jgi:hypothetical protein